MSGRGTSDGVGGGWHLCGPSSKGEPDNGHLSSLVETHYQPHRVGQDFSLLYPLQRSGDVSTDSWNGVHGALGLCF